MPALPNHPRRAGVRIRLICIALSLTATAAWGDNYSVVVEQLREGRFAQAMARADQHLARHPRDAQMRFLKGVVQQQAGKHADAAATYRRLVQQHPDMAEAHHNLALVYLAQGLPDKARDAFQAAKRASRSHAVTYEKLGDIYEELARQTFTQVLRLEDADGSPAAALAPIRQLIRLPTQTGRSTSDASGFAPP